MESLTPSPKILYGDFELVVPEDGEMPAEQIKQILEALETDVEGFQDILTNVLKNENQEGTQPEALANPRFSTSNDNHLIAEDSKITSTVNNELNAISNDSEHENMAIEENKENQIDSKDLSELQNSTGRFKKLKTEDLNAIEENQYSEATKRNTKWGVGVFNGTNISSVLHNLHTNLLSASRIVLNPEIFSRFTV